MSDTGAVSVTGLLLYFGYSMVHSVKGRKTQQQQQPVLPPSTEDPSQKLQQTDMERATNTITDINQTNGQVPQTALTEFNGHLPPRRPPPPRQESLSKLKSARSQDRTTNSTGQWVDNTEDKRGSADGSNRRHIYQPRTGGTQDYQRNQDQDIRFRGEDTTVGNATIAAGTVGRNTETRSVTRTDPAQMNVYSRPRPRPGLSKVQGDSSSEWSGQGQQMRNDPRVTAPGWSGGQQGVQYNVYADVWNENEAVNYKTSNPFIDYSDPEPINRKPKNPFRE